MQHQYIGFILNGNEYTISILRVQKIMNLPSITKLPQSAHYIEGVTNIRGKIIPVVDLKKLIGLYGGGQSQEHQKVIIVTAGRITFGVLVDGITGVVNIADSDIEPPENIIQSSIDQLQGVARVEDKLIVMLDTKKLIPSED